MLLSPVVGFVYATALGLLIGAAVFCGTDRK